MAGKQLLFATPPSGLTTLSNAGVDVVSLANNHGVDFGASGPGADARGPGRLPVAMVGIGANAAEAFAPSVHTVDGVSIAVLAATQLRDHDGLLRAGEDKAGVASMEDPERLLAAVREAATTHDVVVVVPHWGVEKQTCPPPSRLARGSWRTPLPTWSWEATATA